MCLFVPPPQPKEIIVEKPLTRTEALSLVVLLWLSIAWRKAKPVVIGIMLAGSLLGISVVVSDICGHNVGSLGCTAAWNFDGQLAVWMWENVFSQPWWPTPQPR